MTETPPKSDGQRASLTYDGDVAATLAQYSMDIRKIEATLANLSRHETSFVAARKEVLDKIKKTRRRQRLQLTKGGLWMRWLGFQRVVVELRIALTNVIAVILFVIGWLIMATAILALIALGIYTLVSIVEALVNG